MVTRFPVKWLSILFLFCKRDLKGTSVGVGQLFLVFFQDMAIHVQSDADRRVTSPFPDTEFDVDKWLGINTEYSRKWPNIKRKAKPLADADVWWDKIGKTEYFSPDPGQGS